MKKWELLRKLEGLSDEIDIVVFAPDGRELHITGANWNWPKGQDCARFEVSTLEAR